jgi:hypothetical protein
MSSWQQQENLFGLSTLKMDMEENLIFHYSLSTGVENNTTAYLLFYKSIHVH